MTDWTDAEISSRLALAIGWTATYQLPDQTVYVHAHPDDRFCRCGIWVNGTIFDYRDPAVIWPIAERFNCFPIFGGSVWFAAVKKDIQPVNRVALESDTAAKAVALAVIKAKGIK